MHVLHDGYVGLDGDEERVSGTVTLIADSGAALFPAALEASRELLLSFATMIIPGHGAPFRPGSRL